jgi:hypothetical protein
VDRHDLSIDEDTVDAKFLELVDCSVVVCQCVETRKKVECLEANWEVVLRSKILRKCLPFTAQEIQT